MTALRLGAAEPKTTVPGDAVLEYQDGDRVRGRLVERSGDTLVFQSDKFGLLRVPAAAARIVPLNRVPSVPLAPKPVAPPPAPLKRPPVAGDGGLSSPKPFADALHRIFGPWQGRFAIATELVSDSASRHNYVFDFVLKRKWRKDDLQAKARYMFSETNQVATTDLLRADAAWRHDYTPRFFTIYRPAVEWNRAFFGGSRPADYVSLQQELGTGVTALTNDARKLRLGLSQNLFDLWNTVSDTHTSRGIGSLFGELEFKLPWRITWTDRVVWYYPLGRQTHGWENRSDLDKKLTETLTIGLHHEVRHRNPNLAMADYSMTRLMLGFDF